MGRAFGCRPICMEGHDVKRVLRTFAAGARVYAAGGELPDNHPVVKASPRLFEPVPGAAKSTSRKPKAKGKADEQKDNDGDQGDGQEQKDDGDADGDT